MVKGGHQIIMHRHECAFSSNAMQVLNLDVSQVDIMRSSPLLGLVNPLDPLVHEHQTCASTFLRPGLF